MAIDFDLLRGLPGTSARDLEIRHATRVMGEPGGSRYGLAHALTRVRAASLGDDVDIYLRDDRVLLVYAGGDVVRALVPGELERRFGPAAVVLRSRAGKRVNHRVYPDRGLAASVEGDAVIFVEMFTPMSRDEYLATIYEPIKVEGRRR